MNPMNPSLLAQVKTKIDAILPEITALRHRIHQEPELGLDTQTTRQKILTALNAASLQIRAPFIGADLVADLPRPEAEKTICLRADMDALPVREATHLEYQSLFPGVMHACGHDGHSAILVGTALVLEAFREELPVAVRFVFQPGEELVCGGKALVRRGVCDDVAAAYAIHNWPGLPAGQIASRSGPLFAAGAMFSIELTGRGCHGGMPEQGLNPLPAAAALITKLQDLHDRTYLRDGSVISVCSISAGESKNIIPDRAIVRGTARFLSSSAGERIEADIHRSGAEIASLHGVTVALTYENDYSLPVLNTAAGYERVRSTVRRYLSETAWQELAKPSMTCEDFAFYLEGRQGAMFLLGNGADSPALHTAEYDFNDQSLATGILVMSLLALDHS